MTNFTTFHATLPPAQLALMREYEAMRQAYISAIGQITELEEKLEKEKKKLVIVKVVGVRVLRVVRAVDVLQKEKMD